MKIVVLDRDGVINHDSKDYIKSADEWTAIPGSIEAIARLSQSGFTVAVATNQSGLARKYFSKSDLDDIHHKLVSSVEDKGGAVSGIFYCPHLPTDKCDCRKPSTGLLKQIEKEFSCSLVGAPFIGDSVKDIQAAITHGCLPILVKTGNGLATIQTLNDKPHLKFEVFDNLSAAADILVGS